MQLLHNKDLCGVYAIKNLKNGKCYIGSTSDTFYNRLCAHRSTLNRNKHSSVHLQRAWNVYGESNFQFIILEIVNKDDMTLREKELCHITSKNSSDPKFGYNISTQTSNNLLGHNQTAVTREKISKALKGVKRNEVTCAKISGSKTGHLNPMFGSKQTLEHITKRTSSNFKSVVRSDGVIFLSVKAAAIALGVRQQSISQALRKQYKCCGYHFTYQEKTDDKPG